MDIQEKIAKQVKDLKEKRHTKNNLKKITGKQNQTGPGIEQNHPRSKNGKKNEENPKGDSTGERNTIK